MFKKSWFILGNHQRNDNVLLLFQLIYVLGSFLLYPLFKYNFEADGISYISIAFHYANFDIQNAINGTWSPLVSWLLAPFLMLGFDPLLAFRIINVSFGVLILWQFNKLIAAFSLRIITRVPLLLVTNSYLFYWSLHFTQSDLIPLFFLLCYANLIYKLNHQLSMCSLINIGIVGGFSYFSKSYNLVFFILHFTSFCLFLYLSRRYLFKKMIQAYSLSMIVFVSIISLYIVPLTLKYQKLTYSNAGVYNHRLALFTPKNENIHFRHLVKRELIIPPSENSINAWEDVASYSGDEARWQKANLSSKLKLQLRIILYNTNHWLQMLLYFNPFSIAVLLIGLFFLFNRLGFPIIRFNLIYLISLIFVFPVGYFFIIVSSRYFWFNYLLVALLTYYFIDLVLNRNIINKYSYAFIAIVSLFLISVPLRRMYSLKHQGKSTYELAEKIISRNILGNKTKVASFDKWDKSIAISYLLGLRYYGQGKYYENEQALKADLNSLDIELFISFQGKLNYSFLEKKKILLEVPSENFIIYQL